MKTGIGKQTALSPRCAKGRPAAALGVMSRAGLAVVAWILVTAAQADVGRAHAANSAGEHMPGGAASEQDARRIEIDRFKAAPIALRDAMSLSQNRHSGARIVDASFDGEAGVATYRVRAARGDRLWEEVIDAQSGQIVSTEAMSPVTDLDKSDRELLVRLGAVRQELSDGIIVAERNTGGRAISAGLMMEQGRLQFVIVCVAGSDLKQVMLEPPAAPARGKRSPNQKVLDE